jgi:RNA polymerase sigma factor (sigma-70 family)
MEASRIACGDRAGMASPPHVDHPVHPTVSTPPALEALYRSHRVRVLRLCRLLLVDRDEAADVTHDVFLRVEKAERQARSPEDWSAWITRVTVNACHDRRRSAWWRWWRRGGIPLDGDATPAGGLTPEEESARNERHTRVWAALRRLPGRQREVFILRHVEGLATIEVADVLGIAPGSVKRHLFRAVHALRAALGDET